MDNIVVYKEEWNGYFFVQDEGRTFTRMNEEAYNVETATTDDGEVFIAVPNQDYVSKSNRISELEILIPKLQLCGEDVSDLQTELKGLYGL